MSERIPPEEQAKIAARHRAVEEAIITNEPGKVRDAAVRSAADVPTLLAEIKRLEGVSKWLRFTPALPAVPTVQMATPSYYPSENFRSTPNYYDEYERKSQAHRIKTLEAEAARITMVGWAAGPLAGEAKVVLNVVPMAEAARDARYSGRKLVEVLVREPGVEGGGDGILGRWG